jgi:hypothetical protein
MQIAAGLDQALAAGRDLAEIQIPSVILALSIGRESGVRVLAKDFL